MDFALCKSTHRSSLLIYEMKPRSIEKPFKFATRLYIMEPLGLQFISGATMKKGKRVHIGYKPAPPRAEAVSTHLICQAPRDTLLYKR